MKRAVAIVLPAVLVASLLGAAPASAQSRQAQPSQPSPQAQRVPPAAAVVDPNSIAGWAGQAIALIDAGQLAQLWDGASAVAKKQVKREEFIAAVQAARKPLGAVSAREWSVVRRQRNPGNDDVPAGEYASVETIVQFAGNRVGTELVTFRKDEDGTWRFAGYVLR